MATYSQIELDIIKSFKGLMKDHEFTEISIKMIAEKADITRRGFYNHFLDKYDLVSTIFEHDLFPTVISLTNINDWDQGALFIVNYLQDNRDYYKKLLSLEGQNCLQTEFYKLTEMQIGILIPEILVGRKISDEDQAFLSDYYFHAYMGLTTEWVKGKYGFSTQEFVKRWKALLNNSMHNYLDNYAR